LPDGGLPVTRVHCPPEQVSQAPPQVTALLCQVPLSSQVCGWVAVEHCRSPGLHTPVHAPPLQTYGQTEPLFCQLPPLSQTCGCATLQRLLPGEHEPVHTPDEHAYGHADPFACQVPVESQSCG
jgi:hypothetical protein